MKTPAEIAADLWKHVEAGNLAQHNDDLTPDGLTEIVKAAIEADRAQRAADSEALEKVRRYAEDRAAHARHPRLNTVGSGRIASDLFQILGLPYPHPEDDEEVTQ